jgi:hypothetical protein
VASAGEIQYGGYLDTALMTDFNHPSNHQWRDRSTTPKADEAVLDMALASIHKSADPGSPLGFEFGVQTGKDSRDFGYSVTAPNLADGDALRHFSRANVTYLTPVGSGLPVQLGLFNSLIGEESLYAKDNFNYTRTWIADYSPYMMFGVNAIYPFSERTSAGIYLINGYFHLSHPNGEPKYGAVVSQRLGSEFTLKENVFYGPDQHETSIEFWRLFSDSILEWKRGALESWLSYDAGTERIAEEAGQPRVFWMGGAWASRWAISKMWSWAIRPEFYWDRNGRLTGHEQLVRAFTTTWDCRIPSPKSLTTTLRFEYRYDESTGPGGGFYHGNADASGLPPLTSGRNLILAALLLSFGSP